MSFPTYPSCNETGLPWVGSIPTHWETAPYKRLVDIQNGADHKGIEQDEGYPVIGSGGAFAYASEFMYEGDSVLLGRKGTVDKPLFVSGRFWTVDTMYWTKIAHDANPRYAYYTALTIPFDYYSTNTALPSMTKSVLHAHPIALPPNCEQAAIAAFLDRETAKIDALVAEQKRLIELLKEKRQAVISQVVTKGLDPNVPLKDSGVEWLGQVPAHWSVGPIKRIVLAKAGAIKTGPFGSQLTSSDMQAGPIKVYNQRSVIDGDFRGGENYITEQKFSELAAFETIPGDILVTTRGTIGRAAILPSGVERGILHPCLLRVQADPKHIDVDFLRTLIHDSIAVRSQFRYLSNATTIEVIYSDTIANVAIPIPPVEEQRAILRQLRQRLLEIDPLVDEAEAAEALLNERRTALISAAVTGKIDVRGLVPQPEDAPA